MLEEIEAMRLLMLSLIALSPSARGRVVVEEGATAGAEAMEERSGRPTSQPLK